MRLSVVIAISAVIGMGHTVRADDAPATRLLRTIKKSIPAGWKVTSEARNGLICVYVSSSPMPLRASRWSNEAIGARRVEPLHISIVITPRYNAATIKWIRKNNKRLDGEQGVVNPRHVVEPNFYDDTHGYDVLSPSMLPHVAKDVKAISDFLRKLSKNWRSYDQGASAAKQLIKLVLSDEL